MTRLWWVGLFLLLFLLVGCAADWRSQAVQDLWNTRVGAFILRWEFAPGRMIVEPPNPAHAEALARVQATPRRPYVSDQLLETW